MKDTVSDLQAKIVDLSQKRDEASLDRERRKQSSWNAVCDIAQQKFPASFELIQESSDRFSRSAEFDPFSDKDPSSDVNKRLPWHPGMSKFLSDCRNEIEFPPRLSGRDRPSLKPGEFTTPFKNFPHTLLDPREDKHAHSASSINADFYKIAGGKLRDIQGDLFSAAQLVEQEKSARHLVIAQSSMLWLLDVHAVLISELMSQDPDVRQNAQDSLRVVQPHIKSVSGVITDLVSTNLINSTFRRRDAFFRASPFPIPMEVLQKLRSSPLAKDLLFEIPQEIIDFVDQRREKKSLFQYY